MPIPSTQQTVMSLWDGHSPAVDGDGIQRNFIHSPPFQTKTAAYTVLARETGTVFLTTGATAAVTFTLPAISDGPWVFEFIAGADQSLTVASAVVDTLVAFNDLAADNVAFSTASERIGARITAYCDGTTAFAVATLSSEAQTVTVTS